MPRPGDSCSTAGGSKPSAQGTLTSRRYTEPGARCTAQSTAARTSDSENGSSNAIPGIAPSAEMSRTDWCEWPGPPGTSPASEPT